MNDFDIYPGKTFKDLCKDVVERSKSKKDQIDMLLSDIRSVIKDKNDVQMYMPRIKELLEVGIKNDEQLIKLGAVVQRNNTQDTPVDTGGLTDAEKEALMKAHLRDVEEINKIKNEVEQIIK